MTRGCRLSLGLGLSSIVLLVHGDVVGVATIGSIWIRTAVGLSVLGILGGIVCRGSTGAVDAGRWAVSRTRSRAVTTIAATTVRAAMASVRVRVATVAVAISVTTAITTVAAATIAAIATSVAIATAVATVARRAALEFLVLLRDVRNQVFAKLLGLLDHVGIRTSDVEEHILITFPVRRCFEVAGSAALDLHAAARLLLDVLDIGTTVSHNLGAQVESMDGL